MQLLKRILLPKNLRVLAFTGCLIMVLSGGLFWRDELRLAALVEREAVILESRVLPIKIGGPTSSKSEYLPEIRFRYVVDGLTHESSALTEDYRTGSKSWAEAQVAAHPVGSRALCYHGKEHPEVAFLEKERDSRHPIAFGFGLMLALGSFLQLKRNDGSVDLG